MQCNVLWVCFATVTSAVIVAPVSAAIGVKELVWKGGPSRTQC